MTLLEIAEYILDREYEFWNDDNFLDKEYIITRFNLTTDQWPELKALLDTVS